MADDNDTIVPEPEETNPAPEHVPDPVPVHENPNDDLSSIVHSLEEKVNELVTTVASLTPAARDSVPTKKPWTHWGSH